MSDEKSLKQKAAELGLPEGSNWGDVNEHNSKRRADGKDWSEVLGGRGGRNRGES
jgi:hypothetical protein